MVGTPQGHGVILAHDILGSQPARDEVVRQVQTAVVLRVHAVEESAVVQADDLQALNPLALGRQGRIGVVHAHATERGNKPSGQLAGIIRWLVDVGQTPGCLAVVEVPASRGHLVVARHLLQERLLGLGVKAHGVSELLKGVALDEVAVCHVGLDVYLVPHVGIGARPELTKQQAVLGARLGDSARADSRVEAHDIVPARSVKDLPIEATGLLGTQVEHDIVGAVLVAEALAKLVHAHERLRAGPPETVVLAALAVPTDAAVRVVARDAAAVENVAATSHVMVDVGARPHCHLDAVAVATVAAHVVGAELVRLHVELVHHVLVAGDAARGQEHRLVGVELRVAAVFHLADDARHRRGRSVGLHELNGAGVVQQLATSLGIELQHGRDCDFRTHCVSGRLKRGLVCGVHRGRQVIGVLREEPLATCVDHHIEALGLHLLLVPVNKCAGVIDPLANKVLIAFAWL